MGVTLRPESSQLTDVNGTPETDENIHIELAIIGQWLRRKGSLQ